VYLAATGSALAMGADAGTLPNLEAAPAIRMVIARRGPAAVIELAAQSAAPTISSGGVVPLYGTLSLIQPGGWATIYGTNLASGTAVWNGDFPTTLGGTSVTINGKAAYLSMVSAGQINLQSPDDTASGPVSVVVTTGAGTAKTTVSLNPYSPALQLRDPSHVAAIILRADGSGAYGSGAYDILGPTGNCFGYPTVAAQVGDIVEIFGVGMGPTNPSVPAGRPFSGAAPITEPFSLYINGIVVPTLFVGLSSAGLYQINLVVPPGLGQGDVPIIAFVGGYGTQKKIYFSLQGGPTTPLAGTTCVYAGGGVIGAGDGGGGDGGGHGDGGGGDGGGVGDGGFGDGGGDGGDGGDGGGGGDGGDGGDGG
jgi:uncharacterized protein (TIGR03437 family)